MSPGEARPAAASLPVSHTTRPQASLRDELCELYRFRDLFFTWAARDIRIKYKQTMLGVAWAVFQPLAMMAILTVVFSYFARLPSDGIPYPIFAYCALLPWTFFANSLTLASTSLVGNMNLLTKIYFPREILPLATVAGCLLDFGIASVIFTGMMLYYGIPVTPRFLFLPGLVLVQIIFTAGVVLLTSALCVYYRDVKYVVPFGLQLWMFATPVVYPLSVVPERYHLPYLFLNPIAGIVESYRRILLWGDVPDLRPLYVAVIVSVVLFLGAYRIFKRWEEHFADII